MIEGPVLLDSDVLSDISRGRKSVTLLAKQYLERHGRLTLSVVTVFERLRGYRAALAAGKQFEEHLRAFEALVRASIVLPVDVAVAQDAARLWARLGRRGRAAVGDILIAATASANALPLVTRNRRHFEPMTKIEGVRLELVRWA